jgi:glucose-1-phosphate cytidylyltransferase
MKIQTAMILAGGLGTRFKEYTQDIPKPMIEANGTPLLIHIIRIYLNFNISLL